MTFCFRWIFCLLLREFPLRLSIILIDYYLTEEENPQVLCNYLSLAILMRFSFKIKTLDKSDCYQFL